MAAAAVKFTPENLLKSIISDMRKHNITNTLPQQLNNNIKKLKSMIKDNDSKKTEILNIIENKETDDYFKDEDKETLIKKISGEEESSKQGGRRRRRKRTKRK